MNLKKNMLPCVKTTTASLKEYKGVISDKLLEEVKALAKGLKGLKVVMVNATPQGGGVAEILKSLTPLMKGLGLDANWYVLPPDPKFFDLTKNIHNALQGKEYSFSFQSRGLYHRHQEKVAKLMLNMKPDVWIIHDPQPMGVIHYLPNFHPSISHIHIDTTSPNQEVWEFMKSFLLMYDKIIFSTKDFVSKSLPEEKVVVFPPAIDPLTDKNKSLKPAAAKEILKKLGINPVKPLMSQVSRFDPWKDPSGVIKAYRLAKKKIPNLQLALVGLLLAVDDPEAQRILKEVQEEAEGDPDIFLFSDPKQLGKLKVDIFVNAFQAGSDVILQKSTREGFGLTVAEAMWKEKPVIGGKVGGIKLQIQNGKNGFLVSSPEEAASRVIQLVKNPQLSEKLGRAAKESVREKFLMPRLLRDYLKLFRELV